MAATDIAELKDKLNDQALAVAAYLFPAGRRRGREWCVGSVYGEAGDSLSICVAGSKAGTGSDFAAGDKNGSKNLLDLWMAAQRVDLPTALTEIRQHLGIADDHNTSRRREVLPRPTKPQAQIQPIDGIEFPDNEALRRIGRVLNRTVPLKAGMGARWLRDVRDLEPDLLDSEAVRFLPGTDRFPPSLVSVITAFVDASIVLGLQFTALAPDGSRKLWRKFMTGSKPAGGVCRLASDAEGTTELALGESLETCLPTMTAQHPGSHLVEPTWAGLSAGNFANLGPLPGIERLMLLVDADDAGRKGAEKCAALWHHAGRQVLIAAPTGGLNDWNDR